MPFRRHAGKKALGGREVLAPVKERPAGRGLGGHGVELARRFVHDLRRQPGAAAGDPSQQNRRGRGLDDTAGKRAGGIKNKADVHVF